MSVLIDGVFYFALMGTCCVYGEWGGLHIPDDQIRSKKGKEQLELYEQMYSSENSYCWKTAVQKLKHDCGRMSDVEQSILALEFANCHMEKSGMDIYSCTSENFKTCTGQMAKESFLAFSTYTEFFTHVTDICYYLQSDIWRQKTEETISKLSMTSKESLEKLQISVQQQQEVLHGQEASIKNQKEILANELFLKESLLSSAESAKSVFHEVREHAQQQKNLFSETFENIFRSVDRLANIQTMLLGEFIGLQSFAFYFVAIVVSYLFTSTPRTTASRLPLFVGLSVLIFCERFYVKWIVGDHEKSDLNNHDIHNAIWVMRKIFLVLATVVLGVAAAKYKDLNKINHRMLQHIQEQICELKKLQEVSVPANADGLKSSSVAEEPLAQDVTLVNATDRAKLLTKELEHSIATYCTSTPVKNPYAPAHNVTIQDGFGKRFKSAEGLEMPNKGNGAGGSNLTVLSGDLSGDVNMMCDAKSARKKRKAKTEVEKLVNQTWLHNSGYNLRSRNPSLLDSTVQASICSISSKKNSARRTGKSGRAKISPAFFSSDDEC